MDLIGYLIDLPSVTRGKLLAQAHCCLAVYQCLSERERLLVSRLIVQPCHIDAIYEEPFFYNLASKKNAARGGDAEPAPDAGEWSEEKNASSKQEVPISGAFLTIEEKSVAILPKLWDLELIQLTDDGIVMLEDRFAKELYLALSAPNQELSEVETDQYSSETTALSLIEFAKAKWEQLVTPLLRLAHPTKIFPSRLRASNAKLLRVLHKAGLTDEDNVSLTSDGYTFLLSDIPKQVWILANSFLSKELSAQHRADGISFLIFISTALTSGKIYDSNSDTLSDVQRQLLEDWETFGLVRFVGRDSDKTEGSMDKRKSKNATEHKSSTYFTVTPLANAILESSGTLATSSVHIGDWSSGIIVESNFYLYLYTNSSIMIALLELFAHIAVRLPNMAVARLTRQSVRAAFKKGIHARHIIHYLRANKHAAHGAIQAASETSSSANSKNSALALAQTLAGANDVYDMDAMFPTSKSSGLPEQVEDQLQLWEDERFRFTATQVIHWEFEAGIDDPSWYLTVKQYATDLNALVWSDDKASALAIKISSQEPIVAFYRSLKARSQIQ